MQLWDRKPQESSETEGPTKLEARITESLGNGKIPASGQIGNAFLKDCENDAEMQKKYQACKSNPERHNLRLEWAKVKNDKLAKPLSMVDLKNLDH